MEHRPMREYEFEVTIVAVARCEPETKTERVRLLPPRLSVRQK
jgi:hypothetical protein